MKQEEKLMTFTHLGDFSVSKKELEARILEKRKKLESLLEKKILLALSEKDTETLKKYHDFYRIEYQRNGFFDKLLRSKKMPLVLLTQPLDKFVKQFPEIAQQYDSLLDSLGQDLKRELTDKKRSYQYQQGKKEKEERFKGIPFQDAQDDTKASINPEHICLVHATKYFPKKNFQGRYEIETLATATQLKYPRNTIHFACNHYVESHTAGTWEDMPYVILSPLTDVSKLNRRNPMGVSLVDTFYEMDVGENLQLPESTFLIYPASPAVQFKKNQFMKKGKNHAVYKTTFSPSEREELKSRYRHSLRDKEINSLPSKEQDKILSSFIKKDLVNQQLNQMGYDINLNRGEEADERSAFHKVSRLGKRLKAFSTNGRALHSGTIFGVNGINDWGFEYSPDCIGNTVDFLYAITHIPGTLIKKDGYTFIDKNNKEHRCREQDLECVFQDEKESGYLNKGLDSIQKQLQDSSALMTSKSMHVLDAWTARQKKLWQQSAHAFFQTYPSIKYFRSDLKEGGSAKISPRISFLSNHLESNKD